MRLGRRILAGNFVAWATMAAVTVAHASPAIAINEAWVRLLQGRPEEASQLAQADLLSGTNVPRAAVCLVEALHMLGHTETFPESLPGSAPLKDPVPLLILGKRAFLQRRIKDAETNFREALTIAREGNDLSSELVAVEQFANIFQNAGRFPEAIDFHSRALKLAETRGDSLVLISSTYGLAYCLISRGEHAESTRLTDQALKGAHRHGLDLWIGNIEGLQATLAWLRLDLPATLSHLQNAEAAYEDAGDGPRQASSLRRIAATHISNGAYPRAIENLQTARAIALAAGDTVQASFCLEHLGSVHSDLGNLDRAESLWRAALREGGTKWPSEWTNGTLSNLGSLLATRGRHEEALNVFRKALQALKGTSSELNLSGTLTRLAVCLRESGQTPEALEQLQKAVSSARQYDLTLSEALALKETALCHLTLKDLDQAEQYLSEASALAHGSGFENLDQQILVGLANVSRKRGNLKESLRYLEKGMTIGERVRNLTREVTSVQESVFGRSRQLHDEAVDLLYEMHRTQPQSGHDRTAFRVAQRAKARSLLDLLIESKVDLRARADSTYQETEKGLLLRMMELTRNDPRHSPSRSELDRTEEEIAHLESELAILERRVRRADPQYAELKFPDPVGIEKIQQGALHEGELLVEYLLGDERSYVWAATVDTIVFEQLPPREVIEREARDLLVLLSDYNFLGSDPAYLLPHLRRVSSVLLDPLAQLLGQVEKITFCPDGILHFLPFEVLLAGKHGSEGGPSGEKVSNRNWTRFSDVPFLVSRFDVSYAHSGTTLLRFTEPARATREKPTRELLIIGDPVIESGVATETFFRAATGTTPPSLPYVGEEIAQLAELVGREDRRVLTGPNATLPNLRAAGVKERFRLVHFATHGVYNENRPRFSGILLTASPVHGEDGFLTMNEVFTLELECDQVVLSTCSSALGEVVTGEGLVGLTRGLLYAGARSVVAALWNVSGQATSEFMRTLYIQQLAAPNRSGKESHRDLHHDAADTGVGRIRALAEAKRSFIRKGSANLKDGSTVDFAHPYFWAPFVFTGVDR